MPNNLIERIKQSWIFSYSRFLADLWEMGAILVLIVVALSAPFSTPNLLVNYEFVETAPPLTTSNAWRSIQSTLADSNAFFQTKISQFLSAPQTLRIELLNTRSSAITDLSLSLENVASLADVSIESKDLRILARRDSLCVFSDAGNGTYLLPHLIALPPNASMTLFAWGEFRDLQMQPPVRIHSSAESQRIVRSGRANGMAIFIADHLLIISVSALFVTLIIGLSRANRRRLQLR